MGGGIVGIVPVPGADPFSFTAAGGFGYELSDPPRLLSRSIDCAVNGNNILVPGVAGLRVLVYRMWILCNGVVTAQFRDGAAGAFYDGPMALQPGSSISLDLDGEPHFVTTAAQPFTLQLNAATQMSGRIYYLQQ